MIIWHCIVAAALVRERFGVRRQFALLASQESRSRLASKLEALEQSLAAQPGETTLRPQVTRVAGVAHREAVAPGGVNVQFCRCASAFERQVHDHAVVRLADVIIARM